MRNISKFSSIEWNQFREIFYRRNIIIHNAGITNEKYNINNKRNIDKIELIDTNEFYVNEAIKLFLQSASTLKDFFTEKL